MEAEKENAISTSSFLSILNGDADEVEEHSPVKNNPKKSTNVQPAGDAFARNKVKSALKAGFADNYPHNHKRVLAEASIQLKGKSPAQDFIVNLQELLKNGQLVDKHFAFCPIKEDG